MKYIKLFESKPFQIINSYEYDKFDSKKIERNELKYNELKYLNNNIS